ncbi:hypothetical protein B0H15DRAFT_287938 [Mycena belliarum]|uniref:Uncharacterized protein n=1 Tax=Mycena belliarum TaxID=1033014 RepID=A0AAD6XS51_9AGAR|nr:hypothetical protein B0H15DRAFT_287938 [Mycena belliae]
MPSILSLVTLCLCSSFTTCPPACHLRSRPILIMMVFLFPLVLQLCVVSARIFQSVPDSMNATDLSGGSDIIVASSSSIVDCGSDPAACHSSPAAGSSTDLSPIGSSSTVSSTLSSVSSDTTPSSSSSSSSLSLHTVSQRGSPSPTTPTLVATNKGHQSQTRMQGTIAVVVLASLFSLIGLAVLLARRRRSRRAARHSKFVLDLEGGPAVLSVTSFGPCQASDTVRHSLLQPTLTPPLRAVVLPSTPAATLIPDRYIDVSESQGKKLDALARGLRTARDIELPDEAPPRYLEFEACSRLP